MSNPNHSTNVQKDGVQCVICQDSVLSKLHIPECGHPIHTICMIEYDRSFKRGFRCPLPYCNSPITFGVCGNCHIDTVTHLSEIVRLKDASGKCNRCMLSMLSGWTNYVKRNIKKCDINSCTMAGKYSIFTDYVPINMCRKHIRARNIKFYYKLDSDCQIIETYFRCLNCRVECRINEKTELYICPNCVSERVRKDSLVMFCDIIKQLKTLGVSNSVISNSFQMVYDEYDTSVIVENLL